MTPVSVPVRVVFVLVLAQALLIGSAIVKPDLITLVFPWPASPLNARFAGALYLMGAVSAVLGAIARRWVEVRISLVQVLLITGCLLLLTLPHLGEFAADDFPVRWLVFYSLDVAVIGVLLWLWRGVDPAPHSRRLRSAPILFAYAAVTTVAGAVMLVAPGVAVALWPWSLTPILAQVYSVFFLTFAAGAWLAARDPRAEAGRISVTANLVMLVLVLVISVAALDRFSGGARTVVWFTLFGAATIALAAVLVGGQRRMVRPEMTR